MRFLFLLVLLAGAAMGVFYPWFVNNFSGHEIGTWRVYDRASGFKPVMARLDASDMPVRVLVDMTAVGEPALVGTRTVVTITAATDGRTVLADTLTFQGSRVRDESPQTNEKIFRAEAGVIADTQGGSYTFTLGPGDAEGIDMHAVDLVLRADAADLDERAQPIGFSLMAIGVIGFVIAMRRRRGSERRNPNSQPPPPRWGRNGGGSS
ncbi:hypothetical protein EET67_18035 [Pseudaminobacter arsenicus]|uniref:Uncharacterized protein n=1 Tax=Borborobacter arsenicus TaxID=1851146 RepID=A0A432V2V3_9HYPH|nr:hypothetical protein [Pseudaminobacter arsenicus]RUM96445.1 hypothetical protein EET67_18035 [Pseudaminobacter arsenicus]